MNLTVMEWTGYMLELKLLARYYRRRFLSALDALSAHVEMLITQWLSGEYT